MLKKSFSILLTAMMVVVLTLFPACAEESESVDIEPTVLSALNQTSSAWYESTSTRAALIACMYCDVILSENDDILNIMSSAMSDGYIFVVKEGLSLGTVFFGENSTLLAFFSPFTNSLSMTQMDIQVSSRYLAKTAMENIISEKYASSYYEVDGDDVYSALEIIIKILED